MENRNSINVRRFLKLLQLTLLSTLFVANLFAQNSLKASTANIISDSKDVKSIFERVRVVNPKSEKSTDKGSQIQFSPEFEKKAFKILNEIRAENGLSPLNWSEDMAKVARLHSGNMAKFKFFSHQGQDGMMVSDRADSLGITNWSAMGENIAYNRGYDNPVEFAYEKWMLSPGHRDNILNKLWKDGGIGVAIAEDGTIYFTQVFMVK